MRQSVEQGGGVVTGVGRCLWVLLSAVSCIGGGRLHEGGIPTSPVAQFNAPGCEVHTQAGVSAAEASFFMIDSCISPFSCRPGPESDPGALIPNPDRNHEAREEHDGA